MSEQKTTEAFCPKCGGSIISMGRDESARGSVAAWKVEHPCVGGKGNG